MGATSTDTLIQTRENGINRAQIFTEDKQLRQTLTGLGVLTVTMEAGDHGN
jgi:rRNA-processing protein FCF1